MKTQLVVPRQLFVRVCCYVTSMALSYTLCLVVFPVCFVVSMHDTRGLVIGLTIARRDIFKYCKY